MSGDSERKSLLKSSINNFSSSNSDDEARTIVLNCDHNQNYNLKFPDNFVKTSKYSVWTFLPRNLYEQFRKIANVYFLIISGLQLIPGLSPTGKYTTLGPLIFVLSVTAVKEIYEDIRRHKQDRQVNNTEVDVLTEGKFEPTRWRDIHVGDIIKVKNKQPVPADLIIISSSEPQGLAYIETASLDGETNLKIKQALPETSNLKEQSLIDMKDLTISCEQPNNRLYNFVGVLSMFEDQFPLTNQQVLLRGAVLRNTKWILGTPVYTGFDSKLMMNSREVPLKRSNVEKSTNKYILLILGTQLLLSVICAFGYGIWSFFHRETDW